MSAPTPDRDRPWVFRTYSGHSSATASNALYRSNLAKGQTGLSVAFDLPTQTGFDSDHALARGGGRQGRGADLPHRRHVGSLRRDPAGPHEHVDDDQRDGGVAALALRRHPPSATASTPPRSRARPRTTSSRSISRAAPTCSRPKPSMRLIADMVSYTVEKIPKWKSDQHLLLTTCRKPERRPPRRSPTRWRTRSPSSTASATAATSRPEVIPNVVGRISFFLNAGNPLRRRDLQVPRDGRALGRDHRRSLRRREPRSSAASATACR